jgi:hypothetical protein
MIPTYAGRWDCRTDPSLLAQSVYSVFPVHERMANKLSPHWVGVTNPASNPARARWVLLV